MPATIPTRPAGGAVIATAWGQDVHDRTYTPQGALCNGTIVTGIVGTELKLPLATVARGNAAYLNAGTGLVVIPTNGSGLYAVIANIAITNTVSWVRTRVFINGGSQATGDATRGIGAQQAWGSIYFVTTFADGDTIEFRASADAADAADVQLFASGVLRIGNAIATTGP